MSSISLRLDNGGTKRLENLNFGESEQSQSIRYPKSLLFETTMLPRTAFSFNSQTSKLHIGTGEVKFYPSKPDLSMEKMFKRIQKGQYEAIRLATINDDVYYLLAKRHWSSAYYRIGIMIIKKFFLTFDDVKVQVVELK